MSTERIVKELSNYANVLDQGSDIVVNAPPTKTIRIYTYLARWHQPIDGVLTSNQQRLKDLLSKGSSPIAPNKAIKILLFCTDLKEIQKCDCVKDFVRFGADVRFAPIRQLPLRVTWCANRLILGVNEREGPTGVPLINYAIYYESNENDPIFQVANAIFDGRFDNATRLTWNNEENKVEIKTRWRKVKHQVTEALSLGAIAQAVASNVLASVICTVVGGVIVAVFMWVVHRFWGK